MTPPIDRRDPASRTLSRGRCFLYVLPLASHEDVLKLGFSRDPLDRLQALHPRYFEVFDLERAFLVEKLRENGWNITKTAEVIDTPRSNLYKKLEQYNIKQDE